MFEEKVLQWQGLLETPLQHFSSVILMLSTFLFSHQKLKYTKNNFLSPDIN